jgi:hypothetical protein
LQRHTDRFLRNAVGGLPPEEGAEPMSRKLPRSFFWVDQQMIRSGLWLKLAAHSRLAYIALAASCDREGVSIWSRSKLMALSEVHDPDDFQACLIELGGHGLIELLPDHSPPAIRLLPLEPDSPAKASPGPAAAVESQALSEKLGAAPGSSGPITVHTQTTVYVGIPGGRPTHAEPRTAD